MSVHLKPSLFCLPLVVVIVLTSSGCSRSYSSLNSKYSYTDERPFKGGKDELIDPVELIVGNAGLVSDLAYQSITEIFIDTEIEEFNVGEFGYIWLRKRPAEGYAPIHKSALFFEEYTGLKPDDSVITGYAYNLINLFSGPEDEQRYMQPLVDRLDKNYLDNGLTRETVIYAQKRSGGDTHLNQEEQRERIIQSHSQYRGQLDRPEVGLSLGVLMILGTDLRLDYRARRDSPYVFGFRYLDIEDDFVNEGAVGLPGDGSDRSYTKRSGIYVDYLFDKYSRSGSYYATGALFKTTSKIECFGGSDSGSTTGLYFGGGYRGSINQRLGYSVGRLLSPFVNLDLDASGCSSEEEGGLDLNLSLILKL